VGCGCENLHTHAPEAHKLSNSHSFSTTSVRGHI